MCRLTTRRHKQAGMSLLEVLVAFSIMALSLGVLFNLYSQGPRASALAAATNNAILLGESSLTEFIHGNGAATGRNGMYKWDITEQEYTVTGTTGTPPDGLELREYTVRVLWGDQRQRQLEFSTMRVWSP